MLNAKNHRESVDNKVRNMYEYYFLTKDAAVALQFSPEQTIVLQDPPRRTCSTHTVFTHTYEPSTTISKTQNIAIEAVGTRRT